MVPLVYNLWQQLQPEPVEQARERWKQNGPRDYDLMWEEKLNEDPHPTQYLAVVRDGKVWLVQIDHDVLLADELATPLGCAVGTSVVRLAAERHPQRELTGYTVESLFRTIDDNLKKNADSGGNNFATATFDRQDGHPLHYVYRDKRARQRLEWNIKLERR